ncbi:MAG: hypothetical protein H7832_09685 [Magnetococcus sp. DMHC-6]
MATGLPLVFAWQLDGKGGGRRLNWPEIMGTTLGALTPCWLHLNRNSEAARQWLQQRSGIDPFICQSLLATETRPRCLRFQEGVILSLRGVNQNPGAEAHDMLTLRLWADARGVVSLRGRRMFSPEDVNHGMESNHGPLNSGDFIVGFIERLTIRIEQIVESLGPQLERLEQLSHAPRPSHEKRKLAREFQQQLVQIQTSAITLRRYLVPQREAIHRLTTEHIPWISDAHRHRIREKVNDHYRFIEDLDEIRDTARIIQDQITTAASEVMNDLLYKLTLISAFFMPLSFLVGFFGSNTGGMYLGGDPADPAGMGATYEILILVVISLLELIIFRVLKWL